MAKIQAAAIYLGGTIYKVDRPGRHHDVIKHMRNLGFNPEDIALGDQGFVTDEGKFVHRRAALRIAREAGQIILETAPAHGLFSEDVW